MDDSKNTLDIAKQAINDLIGEECFSTLTIEEQTLVLLRVSDFFKGLKKALIDKSWR